MIRRPPRSTLSSSSAASDVYKRQCLACTRCAHEVLVADWSWFEMETVVVQQEAEKESLERRYDAVCTEKCTLTSQTDLMKETIADLRARNQEFSLLFERHEVQAGHDRVRLNELETMLKAGTIVHRNSGPLAGGHMKPDEAVQPVSLGDGVEVVAADGRAVSTVEADHVMRGVHQGDHKITGGAAPVYSSYSLDSEWERSGRRAVQAIPPTERAQSFAQEFRTAKQTELADNCLSFETKYSSIKDPWRP
eukprot:TRINITY_DN27570_c0_g1_i5.p1 TRINITY_DN27570_c0_g1~~TRINITY_DN27570_c0_g1_i5.p1  ORF type:complete len:250 (+),score=74.12 TRINITY_DN27570_c0_g1_i5:103-852(+)